jgi:single-stranded-DNA-specific exonuclease
MPRAQTLPLSAKKTTSNKTTQKTWEPREVDQALVDQLTESLNVSPVLSRILIARGVTSYDEAKAFFNPSHDQLHDPFLMEGMDKAVDRILAAMKERERIMVYGDYDVDGTTAVSLVYTFLSSIYHSVEFYIPDRQKEGYGISEAGIEKTADLGCTVMISLDCGIKANKMADLANKHHIDLIICDHHTPGTTLPEAWAILDPKQDSCSYPYDELSGCGIGFKLIQAISQKKKLDPEMIWSYLDLVAISIACDIVPITGENRVLASLGLQILNDAPRMGIRSLLHVSGLEGKVNIGNLVFQIGPRINAAGRMGHASNAVELLTATNQVDATEQATILHDRNARRTDADRQTTEEALELIAKDKSYKKKKTTVVFQSHWHKGVIGIVASRLIEQHYRPTIVLTESNNMLTGSARSVSGFNVYEAISECSDLLEQFGGHKYAAGLTLHPNNYEAFCKRFDEAVSARITAEQLVPKVTYDSEISLNDITPRFMNALKRMEPFGPGNMRPVFRTNEVWNKRSRLLKEKHLKLTVNQEGSRDFDAIGFNLGDWYTKLVEGQSLNACYVLEENHFRGQTTLQLNLRDINLP